jgi:ribosomal protein S18 acetylase RimI-like enzyme
MGGDVMPESFTIREMTEFDREGVILLLQELQDIETKLHAGRRPWDKADTRAYCDAVTVRMRTGGGKAFVAEAEGKIVGLIMGWVENDRDDLQVREKEKRYGFIGETIVAGAHRRQGVYNALADAMERYLVGEGVHRVRTCTLGSNEHMQAAAERRGYRCYEVIMEKELKAAG